MRLEAARIGGMHGRESHMLRIRAIARGVGMPDDESLEYIPSIRERHHVMVFRARQSNRNCNSIWFGRDWFATLDRASHFQVRARDDNRPSTLDAVLVSP